METPSVCAAARVIAMQVGISWGKIHFSFRRVHNIWIQICAYMQIICSEGMQIPWTKIPDPKNPDPSNLSILRTQKHLCEKKTGSKPYIPEGPMILGELVDFAVESSDGGRDIVDPGSNNKSRQRFEQRRLSSRRTGEGWGSSQDLDTWWV